MSLKTSNPVKCAIIIARQGSSRLPGKALALMEGKPVLWHIIDRLKRIGIYDKICVATSNLPIDRPLIELAQNEGVLGFGGHPSDVLDRLYHAAVYAQCDVVAEIGGDCPLVDPEIAKQGLDLLLHNDADYVCNAEPQTFPDGLDMHVIKTSALRHANERAILSSQRVHPFSYLHKHKSEFKIINFSHPQNLSGYRVSLDYPEDFEVIKNVLEALRPKDPLFKMKAIVDYLDQNPGVKAINAKWNMPRTEDAVPSYWFTKAYIKDVITDMQKLLDHCTTLEATDQFKLLTNYYAELEDLLSELKKRTQYFESKNK